MEIPKLETTIWTCLKPPTIMISSFPLVGSSLYQFSFIRESKSKPWYPMKHPWNPNPRSPAAIRYQWFLCIIYPKELTIYPSIPYQIPRRPLAWYLSFRKAKDNPHDSDSKIPWCFSWFFPELPPKSGLNPSIQHHPSWTKQVCFFFCIASPLWPMNPAAMALNRWPKWPKSQMVFSQFLAPTGSRVCIFPNLLGIDWEFVANKYWG